jgi:uncharacterized protein (TIGR03084 family)
MTPRPVPADPVQALAEQQAELAGILTGLDAAQWSHPTRCVGWDVADVVLHLAQSDEMAIESATGRLGDASASGPGRAGRAGTVDEMVAAMVERERGPSHQELLTRWSSATDQLVAVLSGLDPSTRVAWVAGELSARTLGTTRLAETWIHANDVADAVGITLVPSERLYLIARLAWRTLPYAFALAGSELQGPVAFHLLSPGGSRWDLVPEENPVTEVSGSAVELCNVAARRLDPSESSLVTAGPDGEQVLALIRTYA